MQPTEEMKAKAWEIVQTNGPILERVAAALQAEYERGRRETAERCAEMAHDRMKYWKPCASRGAALIRDEIRSEFNLNEQREK